MPKESKEMNQQLLPTGTKFWTPRRMLVFVIAVGMALFHIYTAAWRPFPGIQQRAIHLSLSFALVFLLFPFTTKGDEEGLTAEDKRPLTIVDLILVFVSLAVGAYVVVEYEALLFRMDSPTFVDILCGIVAILLVLETTRRIIGNVMVYICLAGFAYLVFGEHLPPFMAHTGFNFSRMVSYMYPSTEGILGVAMDVSATVIVLFIIFGAFLEATGAGSLFVETGMAFFGRFRGGPAKACVLGSCLFGMVSGSQTANVAAVGVFTIPLMKKSGYKPEVAAAIEAIGSTGSMIMPPVMGAAAFVIPQIIGGTYWNVVSAAIFPGLLYYLTLYCVVELQAVRYGLRGLARAELPSLFEIAKSKGHMIFPLLVLVYYLAIQMSTATRAAFWSIVACVLASQLRRGTRIGMRKIAFAMEKGARMTLIVAICCASAGIITGVLGVTGLGLRFSDILITLARGNTVALLILTMLASLVIGLPLPPFTSYLILAVLAAPALIKLGINPMAAHLFVFYFGTLGNISPPVAPVSFAAAGVAECDPVRTTNLAFLYCLPSFFVPFLWVYRPGIMLYGSIPTIVMSIVTAGIAIAAMASAIQGYLLVRLSWFERLGLFAGSMFLVYPSWVTDVIGYAIVAGIFVTHFLKARAGTPPKFQLEGAE